jgi:PhnB protein
MAANPIPDGFHTVTPYLVVQGAARLIEFLKQAFAAEEIHAPLRRPDGTIMHAEVRIGDSVVMLGEPLETCTLMPSAFYLSVHNTDAVYCRALQAGATSLMEPAERFYGDRNAGVQDPVGNHWWIATHTEAVLPAELAQRAKAFMQQRCG